MDDFVSPEKTPIIQSNTDVQAEQRLIHTTPSQTINYSANHMTQQNTYSQPPTMADFKQMAMDAYNQRNHQNVS